MKIKMGISRNTIAVLGASLLLFLLASYASINTLSNSYSGSPTSNGSVQRAAGHTSIQGLPSPNPTEQYLTDETSKEREVSNATPKTHSLVNVSPSEIGKIALTYNQPYGGTDRVVLSKATTWAELASLGIVDEESVTIETPPLALVILKGNFIERNLPGLVVGGVTVKAKYLVYVYDLWAGAATVFMASPDGKGLREVLNDPSLPAGTITLQTTLHLSTAPKLFHYGDTLPGVLMGPNVVHQASFSTWSYSSIKDASGTEHSAEAVAVGPNQPYAQVMLNDSSSVATIQQYITANKQMVASMSQRSGPVETWIVFKDYVPADQFRSFATAHKLTAGVSYLRAIDENPNPLYAPYYKLQIVPPANSADPLPQADVDSAFSKLQANTPQLSLKGVYATHAWIDAKDLPALAADPSVYYVDLTANAVRDDLAKAGIAGAAQAVIDTPAHLIFIAMFEQPKSK